jgi:alkanesulfonate monooxygenase SsuD/methylene tetrahydromethanopterin reductase-like flavin-dependent oxidoreductase (luciferase family)
MKFGMFMQPSHPPSRPIYDSIQQDLEVIEWLDELGYSEVWIGEHLTAPWEPLPACDLVLAQAIPRTKQIKLCSGAYVATFYHPAALAHRIMQLDHMCQGRFMCGIAAGGIATDYPLVNVDPTTGQNRDMMRETIAILLKIWTEIDNPWEFHGKYWTVKNPEPVGAFGPFLKPYQKPYPPIGIATLSPQSASIRYAGEMGFLPMSLTFNADYLKDHWSQFMAGAADAGRTVDRSSWRVIREIFVAESDKEARDWARESPMAGMWIDVNLPLMKTYGWLQYVKHDPSIADADVDIDYLIENLWLVGSPETVTKKLVDVYERLGGFGVVEMHKYDYGDTPDAYRRSLELFAKEVVPAFEATGIES